MIVSCIQCKNKFDDTITSVSEEYTASNIVNSQKRYTLKSTRNYTFYNKVKFLVGEKASEYPICPTCYASLQKFFERHR